MAKMKKEMKRINIHVDRQLKNITVDDGTMDALSEAGQGNISRGVRLVTNLYADMPQTDRKKAIANYTEEYANGNS